MGKGSKRRPAQVPQDELERKWDEIFRKPEEKEQGEDERPQEK